MSEKSVSRSNSTTNWRIWRSIKSGCKRDEAILRISRGFDAGVGVVKNRCLGVKMDVSAIVHLYVNGIGYAEVEFGIVRGVLYLWRYEESQ